MSDLVDRPADPPGEERQAARPPETLALAGLAALLYAFYVAYDFQLKWVVDGWEENPYYSHGYLVPVISGWLVWRARAALRTAEWRVWWPGLAVVGVAALLYLRGQQHDINFFIACSGVVLWHGLVLTVGGPQVYRLTWFALSFFFFAVPISWLWLYDKSFPMQMLSAKLGTVLMYIVTGAEVTANGAVMVLDGEDYVVGVACSGFKAIMGLTMVGVLVAYLTDTTPARKAAILALAVPIAVASNVIRLFSILCVGRIWGHDFAVGFFHDKLSGPILLGVAIGVLVLAARLIVGPTADIAAAPPPAGDGRPRFRLEFAPLAAMAAVLFGLHFVGLAVAPPVTEVPDVDLSQIPLRFGDWVCPEEGEVDQGVFEELGNVAVISRQYINERLRAGAYIHVICGRGRRSLHPPTACIRGGGNQILDQKQVEFEVDGERLPFEHVVVGLDGLPVHLAMYTYTDGDVTITDWTKYTGSSVRDRNRVWTQVHFGVAWRGTVEETTAAAEDFLRSAWPEITRTLAVLVPRS